MRRREFIASLLLTAMMEHARAQPPGKLVRIGVLMAEPFQPLQSLQQELHRLGYVEGQTLRFEYRCAEHRDDQYPALANELAALGVDLIVTFGTPATLAAKHATKTIPIVIGGIAEAVRTGVVSNLARPGENVTGFTSLGFDLESKRLELLKELVPHLSRLGVLASATNPYSASTVPRVQRDGEALGLTVNVVTVQDKDDLESGLHRLARARPDAVFVVSDALLYSRSKQTAEFMVQHRLPAMFPFRGYAEAGGLVAYSADQNELFRRAAVYIDRILKGAHPGDLPIQQATKFELIVNLKTARALGIEMPPTILAHADEVIE
jgi:putative tryptophan/tyrosine transport system substrate-binding protein